MSAIDVLQRAAATQGIPVRAAYTVRQSAKLLGIGRETLRLAVHRGQVRAVKVGRNLYIPVSELARLLEEVQELAPPSQP